MTEESNGLAVVKLRLPDLRKAPNTTTSDSTQNLEFTSSLCYWSEFEKEVRNCVLSQIWGSGIRDHQLKEHLNTSYFYQNEFYFCGDEMSVQGRFAHRLGRVMGAVFFALRKDVKFGDFKACISSPLVRGKIPDFAMLSSNGTILAAGELKTPWKHKPSEAIKDDFELRRILSKPSHSKDYMNEEVRGSYSF